MLPLSLIRKESSRTSVFMHCADAPSRASQRSHTAMPFFNAVSAEKIMRPLRLNTKLSSFPPEKYATFLCSRSLLPSVTRTSAPDVSIQKKGKRFSSPTYAKVVSPLSGVCSLPKHEQKSIAVINNAVIFNALIFIKKEQVSGTCSFGFRLRAP